MQEHYIVCGLGIVGYRVVELLHRLGEKVRVVTLSGHDDRIQATRAAGVEVEIADARDPNVLKRLGIMEARALVVTTSKDVVNVEIALDAQRMRADLPIVMRLFDQNLARQLESAFQIRRALGMATVAAPRIAAAATGSEVLGRFSFDGEELVVASLEAARHPELVGKRPRELASTNLRVLTRGTKLNRRRDDGDPVAGDEALLVLTTQRSWDALPGNTPHGAQAAAGRESRLRLGLARLWSAWTGASSGLKAVFGVLVSLMFISVLVFRYGMGLSLIDAVYFMVTTLTTTGYGDISVKDQAVWLKVYCSLMMLLGSATIATVYSLITDWIVTARVRELLGRVPVPEAGHVLVAGLGNVGLRVVEELRAAGVPVVVLEKNRESPFVGGMEQGVPLVVGDARLVSVLEQANIRGARSILAVTGDDAVNLSICLTAKEMSPKTRSIVRLFDAEFARKVEQSPLIDAALGASRIAAPKFVASALFPGVLKALLDGDSLCILLAGGEELDSSPEDRPQVVWQSGKPAFEGDPKGRRRIVQIFRPFVASWETGGIVS
ncbi:MAG: NAD-binding protein [Thermoanaerobaculia bacterium]|nr:NAD-binding protein [Thermoanaerobaculia bacterium]